MWEARSEMLFEPADQQLRACLTQTVRALCRPVCLVSLEYPPVDYVIHCRFGGGCQSAPARSVRSHVVDQGAAIIFQELSNRAAEHRPRHCSGAPPPMRCVNSRRCKCVGLHGVRGSARPGSTSNFHTTSLRIRTVSQRQHPGADVRPASSAPEMARGFIAATPVLVWRARQDSNPRPVGS